MSRSAQIVIIVILLEVFFEELYERGVFGVITTHYANIKSRAVHF